MKRKAYYSKIFIIMEGILFAFLGIFYFSCGDALYVRKSDGNVDEFYATNDVGELTEGMAVEQVYTSQMDVIDTIGVMVSNYGKPLTSDLYVRCEDVTDGHLISEQTFDGETLGINQYVYLDISDSTAGEGEPAESGGSADSEEPGEAGSTKKSNGINKAQGKKEVRGNQVKITCTSNATPGNAPTVLYNVEDMLENEDVAKGA